jgi:hypothetical protein
MHWIRVHILEQLSFVESARNRDLRPRGVESNLFQYHLNQLVRQDYVKKSESRYALAPTGLHWADRYSIQLKSARPQPKVMTIIGIENDRGEYLLKPKLLQPFVGQYYMPSGKLREGEPFESAAQRELAEKLGVQARSIVPHGSARMSVAAGGELVTDFVGFLFRVALPRQCQFPAETMWYAPGSGGESLMPGTEELLRMFCDPVAPREVHLCL